ncbi:hypothetical protein VNO77_09867 [Canavalia gladiata]|uniref:Uncharacterized protein n=1 Tax=Canavalia gladiata TaxID=3824 RepID=A0AAN9MGB4_CANGL
MAEASPSRKSKGHITELEMEAGQRLVQLSEEDNSSDKRSRNCDEEEVDQRLSDRIIANKIREIFGDDEVFQPKKQRRYRSLVNIYMATAPISMLQTGQP